ncbi:MAG: hypothetical protein LC769_13490, partial [Chloroflexi bacterium]|nr:hypothetical protein [Chloroflexota bacterium]
SGVTGEVLALVFLGTGLLGAVLLAFLEVGLSEDRARARGEERRRAQEGEPAQPRRRGAWPRRPRRPS